MGFGKKYFFVDSSNFEKVLWLLREFSDESDLYSQYYSNGVVSAKDIFDSNGIPECYQRIVMKSEFITHLKKYDVTEFVSDFPFYFVNHRNNKRKFIDANCMPFYDSISNQTFYNFVSFKVLIDSVSFDLVIDFFKNLYNDGFLFLYFKSLKDLFDLNTVAVNNIDNIETKFQKVLKKD